MIKDTPASTRSIVNLGSYSYETPTNYIPTITESDYDNGYISRFFIGKINYFDVFETNNMDFNRANPSYFNKIKVEWKITGPEFNVYTGKMLQTTGVVNYNTLQINQARRYVPNIELILSNPKQFWRGF